MKNKSPNVVLLVLDALRARNVSAYGYPRQTTPRLDAFARENVLFRRAFSAATWTVPSHASLLTGLYVSEHRLESIEAGRRFHRAIVTLPEALRRHGYRTAAFSQNMLFGPEHHLEQGFDEFHQVDDLLRRGPAGRAILRWAERAGPGRFAARYLRKMIAPRRVFDAMDAWIADQDRSQPFFLMANVLVPHFPWTVPPRLLFSSGVLRPRYLLKREYLTLKDQWEFNSGKRPVTETHRQVWRRLYDASVRHADEEVGRFLERLRKWPGWEETIVIITSDHGEMLGDYRDLVGHLLSLHDNLIHVPLVVRHPAAPRGLQVEGVVQTLDLYRSILHWTGCPEESVPEAQRRRPALSAAMARPADAGGYAIAEEDYTDSYDVIGKLRQANPAMDPTRYPRRQVAVRSATHKYVWCDDRPAELYDLRTDPDEQHDLLRRQAADRGVLSELQAALESWHDAREFFPPVEPEETVEMDLATIERLRALGYVL